MTKTKSIRQRSALLATVSAVALSIACGGQANASDHYVPGAAPAASDVWVAVEGRFNTFASDFFGEHFTYAYPDGPTFNGDPSDGLSGALEVGRRAAGSPFDFVGRLSLGTANGEDDAYFYDGGIETSFGGSIEVRENHAIADFEVGRNMDIGMGNTRVHAGLRAARFSLRADGGENVNDYYYYTEFRARQKVTAIGPRIGIDQKIPLGSNASIDLSAAGAVLFGKRDADAECFGPGGCNDFYTESDNVTVGNAEASVGLTYLFGPAEATLGYRVDAFWGLYDEDFLGSGDGDRITHGPFAKVKVNFSDDN